MHGSLLFRSAIANGLVNLSHQLFDSTVSDLALEECEIGSLARRILRMRRDKAPAVELHPLVEPLFKSIVGSVLAEDGALKPGTLEPSGMTFFPIKRTPQLKALLRKLRKEAA
jgi:hypothetical protein